MAKQLTLQEWLKDLSENYSVENIDYAESGTFIAQINNDIYLIRHDDLKTGA